MTTSVGDNHISAVHETGRKMLRTNAHLRAWVVARQLPLGMAPAQSDAIADAALDAAFELLERWERGA